LQDLRLRIEKAENVKVYIASYFRNDKDSSVYIVDPDSLEIEPGNPELVIETCNTTLIYAVPMGGTPSL
jgi:hypothetical protein